MIAVHLMYCDAEDSASGDAIQIAVPRILSVSEAVSATQPPEEPVEEISIEVNSVSV